MVVMVVMHDRAMVMHAMMRHAVMRHAMMRHRVVVAVMRRMRRGDAGRRCEHRGSQRQGHEFHGLSPSLDIPNQHREVCKATLGDGCYNLTTRLR